MSSTTIGNPWEYLNGTKYAFGIDAGSANQTLTAGYLLIRNAALSIAVILILSSIANMIWSRNSQERAQHKDGLKHRLGTVVIIGSAAGLLSFLMMICNLLFGVS